MCCMVLPLFLRQVATVSAVEEQVLATGGSRLWLGNLVGSYVSYVDLGGAGSGGGASGKEAASLSREEL